jgi:hypothetical protein
VFRPSEDCNGVGDGKSNGMAVKEVKIRNSGNEGNKTILMAIRELL